MNKNIFQSSIQSIVCSIVCKFTLLILLGILHMQVADAAGSIESCLGQGRRLDNLDDPIDLVGNSTTDGNLYVNATLESSCRLKDTRALRSDFPAKYRYKFSYDKDFSSIASADMVLSLSEAYRFADNNIFNNPDSFLLSFAGYLSRMLITAMLSTAQHEFGGHGARLREFGVDVKGYAVHFDGKGHTSFDARQFDRLHPHKKIASIIGGVESSYVMSQKLADRFLEEGKMDPVNAMLYIWAATDQVEYVFSMKKQGEADGHDIADYIKQLNTFYGDGYVDRSRLRKYALADLLDPMLYFAAYSFVSNEQLDTPMINIGDYGYLPAFHSIITPYGPELSFVNHIKQDDRDYKIVLSHGKNRAGASYNMNLIGHNLYKAEINGDIINHISVGAEIGVWRQPKMFVPQSYKASMQSGVLAEIKSNLNILNRFGMNIALGYKSRGFALGRPLTSSAMLRLGFELDI